MRASALSEASESEWTSEWVLEIACLFAFAASLLLPAFDVVANGDGTHEGYFLLFFGFLAALFVGRDESLFFSLAWFANIAFMAAHLSLALRRAAHACAFAAAGVVLSGSFALVKDTGLQGMCARHPIKLHAGYTIWVVSMTLSLGSALVALRRFEGPGFLWHHKRAVMWIAFLSCSYVVVGVLLPVGKCSLLP